MKYPVILAIISILMALSGPTLAVPGILDTAQALSSMTSRVRGQVRDLTSFITSFMSTTAEKRGNERYRHNYLISPETKPNTAITKSKKRQTIPMFWDLSPKSYPVAYMLYTKNNRLNKEVLTILNSTNSEMFDRLRETKIIIHDYNQSANDPMLIRLKTGMKTGYYSFNEFIAYLNANRDYNIMLVDWEQARMYSYTVAVTVTEHVGIQTARLIEDMKADLQRVHVIGFGLGAHAAGVLGHELDGKVRRITGLDPSLPLFRLSDDTQKLDISDATFVDVIHTDGGDNFWHASHLGMGDAMGHADFYVNSGIFQPGCPAGSLPSYEEMYCSHLRSMQLFLESVENKESVVGCSCNSWAAFKNGKCDCRNRMVYVGEECPIKARGKFFLITRDWNPYGMGRKGANPPIGGL